MGCKVIIKRPDEKIGHMTWIAGHLKNLQTHVEGYIETLTIQGDPKVVLIMNEEGKILGLPENFRIWDADVIRGTVVVCGVDGDDFADIPISRQEWKAMLEKWGNDVDD